VSYLVGNVSHKMLLRTSNDGVDYSCSGIIYIIMVSYTPVVDHDVLYNCSGSWCPI